MDKELLIRINELDRGIETLTQFCLGLVIIIVLFAFIVLYQHCVSDNRIKKMYEHLDKQMHQR